MAGASFLARIMGPTLSSYMSVPQVTPLNAFHRQHGGRMVDFAGWDMPVQYRSILEEHKAVRQRCGLFDVSHMGEADVQGPDALKFLQHLVTNDCRKLFPGRILYTVMCYPHGGVVDDLLVYMRAPDDYLLCINAGNIAKDIAWMKEQAQGFNCSVVDRSADYAQLAVQGPTAAALVQTLTLTNLAEIKYYHFGQGEVAGVKCLISRTGYTGEDGFELYCDATAGAGLAEAILAAGGPFGLELTGLGARDSLRLEAGFMVMKSPTKSLRSRLGSVGWLNSIKVHLWARQFYSVKKRRAPRGRSSILRRMIAGSFERKRRFAMPLGWWWAGSFPVRCHRSSMRRSAPPWWPLLPPRPRWSSISAAQK